MLRRAEVGETPPNDGVVEPGMVVTYKFVGDDDEPRSSCSAPARSSDGDDLEVYSPAVPARRRDHRRSQGRHRRATTAPNGKSIKVEIVDAVPYTG